MIKRLSILFFLSFSTTITAQTTSPEKFLGFAPGSDKKLADWTQITNYFTLLSQQSPRVNTVEIGRTTEGKPIVMAIISSARNLKRIAEIKEAMHLLADPRLITVSEKDSLIQVSPTVTLINCSLHSTEIGASQFSMQFAYNLAKDNSKTTRAILSRTVCLLIPSSNPDGHNFVVDWYRKTLGTPAEGSYPPGLYHKYAGHDNNRDWFMLNLQETKVVTKVLYKEWFPQVIFDMHEMGSEGPRLVIPPQFDNSNPLIDPIIHQEIRNISDFILKELTDQNVTGIATNTVFDMWWHGGFRTAPYFHNMVGVLSEVASSRLATPDTIKRSQRYFTSTNPGAQDGILKNTLKPWSGTIWRLADIVNIENISARALLEVLARGRKTVLDNFYLMGRRAIDQGLQDSSQGYVIPFEQHDPSSAKKLLEILMAQGIEIYKASPVDEADVYTGKPGFYIPTAQPYRSNILCLFEPLKYPKVSLRPYDITAWTLPYQMGVSVEKIDTFPKETERIVENEVQWPVEVQLMDDAHYFALDPRSNDTYRVVQKLLEADIPIRRIYDDSTGLPNGVGAGWFLVDADVWSQDMLQRLSHTNSLNITSVYAIDSIETRPCRKIKLALLEACTGNIDQGWTQFVLDTYEIPYDNLQNCDLKTEEIVLKYDAIILPSISARSLMWGERSSPVQSKPGSNRPVGLGVDGLDKLQSFVRAGGTLISFGEAAKSIASLFELNMQNIIHPFNGFSAPGSLLQISLKQENPLCYGMPAKTAIFYNNDPAFIVQDGDVVGRYEANDSFLSGYIKNGEILEERAAMVCSDYGKGKVVLFGFRPQHRGQTFSTFKLVFNAILSSNATFEWYPLHPPPTEE
ncbi:MAG: hypothetical protein DWQ05_00655 [Calditrichaeota bacterium]|nr:MAG: hypothetical protein DWQ05_00655 [Calditrichota bacterium]